MKRFIFTIITGIAIVSFSFGQTNRGIFIQEGIASWYGNEFNGRPTASGEIFTDTAMTAAHPFLPFGTMLKVTNQHNNKSVVVRVNDRGPFVAARIIDLSRSAAAHIDMISTGTAPVKVESIEEVSLSAKHGDLLKTTTQPVTTTTTVITTSPISTQPLFAGPSVTPGNSSSASVRFSPSVPSVYTGKNYRVQVGAYKHALYAQEAYDKLVTVGLKPAFEKYGDLYRVILPGIRLDELVSLSDRLILAGFKEAVLREE